MIHLLRDFSRAEQEQLQREGSCVDHDLQALKGRIGGQIARHHDNDRSELGLATKRTLEQGNATAAPGLLSTD